MTKIIKGPERGQTEAGTNWAQAGVSRRCSIIAGKLPRTNLRQASFFRKCIDGETGGADASHVFGAGRMRSANAGSTKSITAFPSRNYVIPIDDLVDKFDTSRR